jgi:hypothetical protein
MIIGGFQGTPSNTAIEIYSPNGLCNFNNKSTLGEKKVIFVLIANSVVICGNSNKFNCWKFDFRSKKWTTLAQSKNTHSTRPAKVYQNKLYIVEDLNPEIYDAENNDWSTWERPLDITGGFACSAIWKDTLLVVPNYNGISNNFQQYNFTSKVWNFLNGSEINFLWPTCLILPGDENKLLVAGFENRAELYDTIEKQWISIGNTSTFRIAGDLVALGKRVFYLSGIDSEGEELDSVEEFHFTNKSWTLVNKKMLMAKRLFKAISIPAFLFQDVVENCTGEK